MKQKILCLTISISLLAGVSGSVKVFHCQPSNTYCGFNVSEMEKLDNRLKESKNSSERYEIIANLGEKIRGTENESKKFRLKKEQKEWRDNFSDYRQLKREYQEMRRFYKFYINDSNISYSEEKRPIKIDTKSNRFFNATNFYPIQNYSHSDLRFTDGCVKTNVRKYRHSDLYGVSWSPTSEPWYCISGPSLLGPEYWGVNLFESPLRYASVLVQ
ncbi:MAG: hypothetical protein BRC28_02100 [Nanohaloarchaea archaeon SW_4_43_9]|nr:MAG: hypothetical protein BRC28_02100 [Nanohaloarchaea archaeon SW_4_43_9]